MTAIRTFTHYSCPAGDALFFKDGRVTVSLSFTTHVDEETSLYIATSGGVDLGSVFKHVGQGETPEGSVHSLREVLRFYLQLGKVYWQLQPKFEEAPWQRHDITATEADRIVATWSDRPGHCLIELS